MPQSWNNGIVARPGATCLVIAIGSSYPRHKIFKTRSQKKRSGPGNDGIVGFQRILSILNFIVKTNFAIYPILQYPLRAVGSTSRRPRPIIALKLHFVPNIPAFHHSNRTTRRLSTGWGEAPNLCSKVKSLKYVSHFIYYQLGLERLLLEFSVITYLTR